MVNTLTGWTGRQAIRSGVYIVDLTVFIQLAIRDWLFRGRFFNRATYRSLVNQLLFTGVDALPLVSLLSLAVGVAITSQLIHLTSDFTEAADIIETLAVLTTYEVSPFLTAIILVARSGSAISVDLGNMKLHGEIEGLELLGINLNDYLIAPRLIAGAISQLVLAIYFSGIALYGGLIAAGILYSTSYLFFFDNLLIAHTPDTLLLFVFKNLVFGLVIAGTACYHALQVAGSSTEVPRQTQRVIVNSLAIIAVFDGLLAVAAL
ncbi:MAG TPA: ABC transporter permease [Gammaproteobacteria bacterium]